MRLLHKHRLSLLALLLLHASIYLFGQNQHLHFESLSEDFTLSARARMTNDIFQDSRGYIWIASLGGLLRYDGYEEKLFTHEPGDSLSLSDSKISSIQEDGDGFLGKL